MERDKRNPLDQAYPSSRLIGSAAATAAVGGLLAPLAWAASKFREVRAARAAYRLASQSEWAALAGETAFEVAEFMPLTAA